MIREYLATAVTWVYSHSHALSVVKVGIRDNLVSSSPSGMLVRAERLPRSGFGRHSTVRKTFYSMQRSTVPDLPRLLN